MRGGFHAVGIEGHSSIFFNNRQCFFYWHRLSVRPSGSKSIEDIGDG